MKLSKLMGVILGTLVIGQVRAVPTNLASAATLPATAFQLNQGPSDVSLQRLMAIMQFDNNLNQRLEQNKGMAEQAIQHTLKDALQDTNLTASQLQQIQQVSNEFLQKILDEQNRPEVRQKMLTIYQQTLKETYTQAEIDAMINFYSTPTGQAILSKQNRVSKTYTDKIMPFTLESTQSSAHKFLPDYQRKLEKILKKTTSKVKN